MKPTHLKSVSVSVSVCSFSLFQQMADVTLRQAGLSDIIKVLRCDTAGLEGTEIVWSTSTCRYIIFSPPGPGHRQIQSYNGGNESSRGTFMRHFLLFIICQSLPNYIQSRYSHHGSCSFYIMYGLQPGIRKLPGRHEHNMPTVLQHFTQSFLSLYCFSSQR